MVLEEVKESAQLIASLSSSACVNGSAIDEVARKLAEAWKSDSFQIAKWENSSLNPKPNAEAIDWIFVVDTLNFSFWHDNDDEPYTVFYRGKAHTGYWSLCAAINRALEEGIPVTSPSWYSSASLDDLAHIFRSETNTEIPMLKERVLALHEAGRALYDEWGGSFAACIAAAGGSADALVSIILRSFPTYRDCATYGDRPVAFYKRAQILVADIYACFQGQGPGAFDDIHTLTMFADYRVPQMLSAMGVLKYSDELMARLHARELLLPGAREEIELRGCSIHAVELLVKRMREILQLGPPTSGELHAGQLPVCAITVDFYLWNLAKLQASEIADIPIHCVRTVFY